MLPNIKLDIKRNGDVPQGSCKQHLLRGVIRIAALACKSLEADEFVLTASRTTFARDELPR